MPISENLLKKIILAVIFFTFFLLLFKNPFSERNLIANLEPYPDTVHYLNPPLSLLNGKGFVIEREDRTMRPSVPFLYSASLLPGFFIYSDVRFFYFTNIVLAFLGLVFFYQFLKKIFNNEYVNLLILFLYITNYFIFWYPNLAMAENLLLALYNIGLFLLFSKLSVKNAFLAGIIGISLYATKYASISLSLAYLVSYFLKTYIELFIEAKEFGLDNLIKTPGKFLKKRSIFFVLIGLILGSGISLGIFFTIDSLVRGNNIFYQVLELISPLATSTVSTSSTSQSNGWFAASYFKEHLLIYLNALLGSPMRFLWDQTPIVPRYIALPALLGIVSGFFVRKYWFLSVILLTLIVTPIVAIAPFYTTDARYIYHTIPTLLSGFGLFLILSYDLLNRYKLKKVFYLFLISVFIFYGATNFLRLKYQIALNLRHSETPWYYISVKSFNEYFQTLLPHTQERPILITALQPFYIDFFSNSSYGLLPLSKEQEFMRVPEIVWGQNNYTDLIALYKKYLAEGKVLYVSNAALGNEVYLHNGFNQIKENFIIEEVNKGCFDTCNIYKVIPKN